MENNIVLEVKNLSAGYGKRQVLFDVSFEISPDTITLLIGPNGSGKSTLIKTISGLVKPWTGEIIFKGMDITRMSIEKRIHAGIGYLKQTNNIFPMLTVRENLELSAFHMTEKDFVVALNRVLDYFPNLIKHLNRRAGLLSGGERQALAIAMVLINKKDLLLLDEPVAGLDPKHAGYIIDKIVEIHEKEKLTILMVEHNLKLLAPVCNEFIAMENGRILRIEHDNTALLDYEKLKKLFFNGKK